MTTINDTHIAKYRIHGAFGRPRRSPSYLHLNVSGTPNPEFSLGISDHGADALELGHWLHGGKNPNQKWRQNQKHVKAIPSPLHDLDMAKKQKFCVIFWCDKQLLGEIISTQHAHCIFLQLFRPFGQHVCSSTAVTEDCVCFSHSLGLTCRRFKIPVYGPCTGSPQCLHVPEVLNV